MSEGNAPLVLIAEEAGDRRRHDRRAQQRPFDPLFAATLLNQIEPEEEAAPKAYAPPRRPRAGIAFDLCA